MRKIVPSAGLALLLLAACGGGSGGSAPTGSPTSSSSATKSAPPTGEGLSTSQVQGVGTVLVDARGYTIYHLQGETASDIQCTGDCESTWPPVLSTAGGAKAGSDLPGKLGTVTRPEGGEQVTYNGLLLYTYSGDTAPGQANGQGVSGVWYAVTPSAKPGGGSSTGGGYGGYGSSPSSSGGYQYPGG